MRHRPLNENGNFSAARNRSRCILDIYYGYSVPICLNGNGYCPWLYWPVFLLSESICRTLYWDMSWRLCPALRLPMSARFSVKNVILARMGIMGIENLLLTVVLAVFTKEILLRGIMCLFTPYLFTVYLCFKLIRATHGREGIYACAAVAVFNGGVAFYSSFHWRWIFGLSYHFVWMAVMVMLFLLILCEGKRVLESKLAYIV